MTGDYEGVLFLKESCGAAKLLSGDATKLLSDDATKLLSLKNAVYVLFLKEKDQKNFIDFKANALKWEVFCIVWREYRIRRPYMQVAERDKARLI